MIRSSFFAGSFYPAKKKILQSQIKDFLAKAENRSFGKLKILIVPHAGYLYSGQTAAWGFKQIMGLGFKKIILLGCSHQAYFSSAACFCKGGFQTPLGTVPIAESLAKKLVSKSSFVKDLAKPHLQEHSLEVQLPFLQVVLTEFKIVPLLLGFGLTDFSSFVLELASLLEPDTLLIISSDLSHYPSYKTALQVDGKLIKAIESGDINRFNLAVKENELEPGVETACCGRDAVKTGLLTAKALNLGRIVCLNYVNSGDTGGDKNRVVGYASIGMYE
jgi:MEMO1 family protein